MQSKLVSEWITYHTLNQCLNYTSRDFPLVVKWIMQSVPLPALVGSLSDHPPLLIFWPCPMRVYTIAPKITTKQRLANKCLGAMNLEKNESLAKQIPWLVSVHKGTVVAATLQINLLVELFL